MGHPGRIPSYGWPRRASPTPAFPAVPASPTFPASPAFPAFSRFTNLPRFSHLPLSSRVPFHAFRPHRPFPFAQPPRASLCFARPRSTFLWLVRSALGFLSLARHLSLVRSLSLVRNLLSKCPCPARGFPLKALCPALRSLRTSATLPCREDPALASNRWQVGAALSSGPSSGAQAR